MGLRSGTGSGPKITAKAKAPEPKRYRFHAIRNSDDGDAMGAVSATSAFAARRLAHAVCDASGWTLMRVYL